MSLAPAAPVNRAAPHRPAAIPTRLAGRGSPPLYWDIASSGGASGGPFTRLSASDEDDDATVASRYGIALAAVAGATALTALTWPWLRPTSSPLFLAAVVLTAVRAGLGPGLLVIALSVPIKAYVFVPPTRSLLIESVDDAVELAVFALVAVLLSSLSGSLRREQERNVELLAREAEARAEAERANRAKDHFLAAVSHELRTPLTAITAAARVLRTTPGTAPEGARALALIERSARSQARLVDDLLDVARIATGKLRLQATAVDLADVVASAVATTATQAQSAGVEVRADVRAPAPARVDPERLQQVVVNLLSNAVKFTPPGGRVTVAVEQTDATSRIAVVDTGCGIAPELLPRVFEPFWQAEDGPPGRGLGLGLAIVRHVVEAHGGTVRVASEGTGRGATFVVELPLAAPAHAGRGASAARPTDQ